jgi:hypothetical protein
LLRDWLGVKGTWLEQRFSSVERSSALALRRRAQQERLRSQLELSRALSSGDGGWRS